MGSNPIVHPLRASGCFDLSHLASPFSICLLNSAVECLHGKQVVPSSTLGVGSRRTSSMEEYPPRKGLLTVRFRGSA